MFDEPNTRKGDIFMITDFPQTTPKHYASNEDIIWSLDMTCFSSATCSTTCLTALRRRWCGDGFDGTAQWWREQKLELDEEKAYEHIQRVVQWVKTTWVRLILTANQMSKVTSLNVIWHPKPIDIDFPM